MQRFKSHTARSIIDHLQSAHAHRLLELLTMLKRVHKTQSEHQFWEEGSHPQRIEHTDVMRQKLDYIHQKPNREEAGFKGASGYQAERGK